MNTVRKEIHKREPSPLKFTYHSSPRMETKSCQYRVSSKPPDAPQWVDFFGRRDAERWMDVLGAFCFVYANRGHLTIEGVCNALKPILEEFEAELIMDWGMKTGVLEEDEDGLGLRVGEWWWLAVPWQWGRQLKARREVED
ncbi:hypothetical protein FOC4_g10010928 [Fusarium odoratissimum]|uniref:Transcription factor tau subunit sfc3/Tfc3 C-terminal domain-containing protein n=1 Tax=Fusarium oxysporum f. sp. cubense (strain race 4) TaxID=2502994 RepID=N1RGW1_FUSC4|nr:hypothetical protein FOC4_g10010928 [Fusarium odoratissimum]